MNHRFIALLCVIVVGSVVRVEGLPSTTDSDKPTKVLNCYQMQAPRLHLTVPSREVLNRIYVPAGTELHAIEVELSGPPTVAAGEIVVYGHSVGLIAPRTEEPIVIGTLHKKHHGIEKIHVPVDVSFRFTGGQAFIGMRNVPDSVHVLLVSDTTLASCEDQAGSRQTAVYRGRDQEWKQTSLPMAVSLVVEYPTGREGGFVLDTTIDAAADIDRYDQAYLSAGDVNGDGLIDLAAAGLLYVNSTSGFSVLDLSSEGRHPYVLFVDAEGDGRDDLITMDLPCATGFTSWRWHDGRLRQLAQADLPGGCLTPVSAVVLAEGQQPVILLSGYTQGKAVVLSIAPGARPLVVDVSKAFAEGDSVAPILLAADIDGDYTIEIVTRSTSTDRIFRYLGKSDFVEIASTTFAAPALELSASTFTKVGTGTGTLELPRSVSWREDAHQATHKSGSIVGDPRSNTIARNDERPSSRQYADLDNDGTAEMIEFGQGACRSMVVFSLRDATIRDVTHEYGLGGIRGATDGLIVDLDMDGRLDLVVDRLGRVEVRYNRLTCPKATSINLYGAGAGAHVRTAQHVDVGSLVRGRGRLIEDAQQIHVNQPSVDSLIVERRIGDQHTRSRHVVEDNRTSRLSSGQADVGVGGTSQPTLAFDGETLTLQGFHAGASATLHVVTMNGETIARHQLDHISDAFAFPLQQLLLESQAASGSYSIQVAGTAGASTIIITFVR